jgi:signal transduction histidine kinase
MTVVHGFTTTANGLVDDEEVSGMLDTVERKADELVALGEKARSVEQVVAREPRQTPVALDDLLASVVEDLRGAFPERTVALDCPPVTLETDEETLRVVAEALVENALQHGSPDDSDAIRVGVDAGEESVTVRVADEGPGVPDQELAVIGSGRETDLEHSTGLGLWLASWGARQLGGDLAFDVSDDGTVASLTLPRRGTGE